MPNFKHGDKVTCKIDEAEIADARISIGKDGYPYICQNIMNGGEAEDKLGYKYSWFLHEDFTSYNVTDLRLAEKTSGNDTKIKKKTWDNLEVGDSIWNKDGTEYKIVDWGVNKNLFSVKNIYGNYMTEDREIMIKNGYTTTPPQTITREEAEKILGKKIK